MTAAIIWGYIAGAIILPLYVRARGGNEIARAVIEGSCIGSIVGPILFILVTLFSLLVSLLGWSGNG